MAQLIQNGDVLSGTSNDSANILYSEPDGSSKNVQEKIIELDNEVEELNNNLTVTNNNMKKIKTYVGTDGKIHFVDSTGADSVLPFSKSNVYYLGVGTSFNIKSKLPNDYAKLTVNNFIVGCNSASVNLFVAGNYAAHGGGTNAWVSKNYTASTGILTVSNLYAKYEYGSASATMNGSCFAYLVVGDITNI